ncbi:MAG: HNH endonuclease, partial [Nanoarchaeota archaeon]|nr:HNH endonuclease [Nanoarchaeota archaeon]
LFLFMSIFFYFFLSYVSALECQYKVNETYQEFGNYLFDSNGDYFGEPLILKDFVSEYMNLEGCSPVPSFKIYNQYDFPVNLHIVYTLFHPRINTYYPESERKMESEIEIAPYSEERIDSTCLDIGTNQILEESISYTITGEKELILKKGNRQMQREICKICPSGKQCLNDNSLCNSDNECGSLICNIAGFCGNTKVMTCPNGLMNCNNQSCLYPSIKESGEGYSCVWECKSGSGKSGICERDFRENLIFLVFILIGLGIGLYFIFKSFYKKSWEKEESRIIKEAEEKAEEIISSAKNKLKRLSDEIEKSEKLKTEINSLKRGSIEARKIKKELEETNESIQKERIRQKEEIDNTLEAYGKRYGHRFVLDNKGYIRFAKGFISAGIGGYLHRWIYKNAHGKINDGYEIHHKDFNKFNNEINNLEELTPKEHQDKHLNRHRYT